MHFHCEFIKTENLVYSMIIIKSKNSYPINLSKTKLIISGHHHAGRFFLLSSHQVFLHLFPWRLIIPPGFIPPTMQRIKMHLPHLSAWVHSFPMAALMFSIFHLPYAPHLCPITALPSPLDLFSPSQPPLQFYNFPLGNNQFP